MVKKQVEHNCWPCCRYFNLAQSGGALGKTVWLRLGKDCSLPLLCWNNCKATRSPLSGKQKVLFKNFNKKKKQGFHSPGEDFVNNWLTNCETDQQINWNRHPCWSGEILIVYVIWAQIKPSWWRTSAPSRTPNTNLWIQWWISETVFCWNE